MRNYIFADMKRIFRRVPHVIVMLIIYAAFVLAVYLSHLFTGAVTGSGIADSFAEQGLDVQMFLPSLYSVIMNVAGFFTAVVGLLELIAVFSDDLKAKTMQVAIGVGISRSGVVLCKMIELLMLLVLDVAVIGLLGVGLGCMLGVPLSGQEVGDLFIHLGMGYIVANFAYACLTAVVVFASQSMTSAILTYLALSFYVVSGIIGMSSMVKVLEPLHLSRYTLSEVLDALNGMVESLRFNWTPVVGLLAYMVVSIGIAIFIFRKKELEF